MNSVKKWINDNKHEIDFIIENTIEEHFEKQELLGQIKLLIKSFLGIKVSESFNIVEKIILQFENYFNKSASLDFTQAIISFLENKTLNDVINILGLNQDKVFNVSYNFIISKSNILSEKISEYILNLSLDKIISFFYKKQINFSVLINIFIKDKINNLLKDNLIKYKEIELKEFFTEEKFNSIKNYLPFLLMFGQEKIKVILNDFIDQINYKEKIISNIKNEIIYSKINENYKNDVYNAIFKKFKIAKNNFLDKIKNFIDKEEIISYYKKEVNKKDKNKEIVKLSIIYSVLFEFINIHINNLVSLLIFLISFFSSKKINNKILKEVISKEIKINDEIIFKLKQKFSNENKFELYNMEIIKIINENIFIDKKEITIDKFQISNVDDISLYFFEKTNILFSNLISKFIHNYINSKKISDIIKTENIIKIINNEIENYNLNLEINKIIDFVYKYDFYNLNIDKYINKNFRISQYLYFEKKIGIGSYLNKTLNNFINDIIKNTFISNELSSEKEINTLFNGEIINYIKLNINKITKSIIFDVTINKLKKEKENIIENVIKNFQQYTEENIWYDLGNSLFDIESDIKQIINVLIEEKLNNFFVNKELEIENIINSYIELLSYKKLGDIGISEDTFNIDKLILIINDVYNHLNLDDFFYNIFNNINLDISIEDIISILEFNNIDEFLNDKKELFIKILKNLQIKIEFLNIKDKIKYLVFEYLNKTFSNYNLKDLIDDEFLKTSICEINKKIISIYSSDDLKIKINNYSSILSKKLSELSIEDLFTTSNFEIFINETINNFNIKK
ncbi:MAG: hypothetical protein KatS3mg068_0708 [Candidatus Sericytochromatia bacterium]|nr:MAG: hypothetical protein KatS3mg068_0708 [Candidatus Sericytochromatia bacterium]